MEFALAEEWGPHDTHHTVGMTEHLSVLVLVQFAVVIHQFLLGKSSDTGSGVTVAGLVGRIGTGRTLQRPQLTFEGLLFFFAEVGLGVFGIVLTMLGPASIFAQAVLDVQVVLQKANVALTTH